jgi:nucleoside phosphorylase/tetratricopeptide (TPR) repeat protein
MAIEGCDVCLFTSVPDEFRALRTVFERLGSLEFRESYTKNGREVFLGTMQNRASEALRLQISCLPEMGGSNAMLHIAPILDEYLPRFVGMTGICAGDREKVKLGDLVVAIRAYEYEAGKVEVVNDEAILRADVKTFSPNENIIGYTNLFEGWKDDVGKLKRPPSKRQQRDWLLGELKKGRAFKTIPITDLREHMPQHAEIVAEMKKGGNPWFTENDKLTAASLARMGMHWEAYKDSSAAERFGMVMGSGRAVRSDNPFPKFKGAERKLIAVEMEGSSVYQAVESIPTLGKRALVVKGVSDYGDEDKDDSYRHYASEASAIYMFHFLRQYVTTQLMPRLSAEGARQESVKGGDIPAGSEPRESRPGKFRPFFFIPLPRYPLLRGRESTIFQLRKTLAKQRLCAVIGSPGVGKTQVSVEYGYRYRGEYDGVFWCSGLTADALAAGWRDLAERLGAPETSKVAALQDAVRYRLSLTEQSVLIIIDAVQEPSLLVPLLPLDGRCHFLITALDRDLDLIGVYDPIRLMELETKDAVSFLVERTARANLDDRESEAVHELVEIELKSYPLALEQAGAFLVKTRSSFADYLTAFRSRALSLLELGKPTNYPTSLRNTVSETLERIGDSPASLEIARFIAFLDEDALPRPFVVTAARHRNNLPSSPFAQAIADPLSFDQLLVPLFDYSLISEDRPSRNYRMHSLIRLAVRDLTPDSGRAALEDVAVKTCLDEIPEIDVFSEQLTGSQAFYGSSVAKLILSRGTTSVDAGHLLQKVGHGLLLVADVADARRMIERAIEILKVIFGDHHPELAPSYLSLAALKAALKTEPTEVSQLYSSVINIADPASQRPLIAVAQNNLAELFRKQARSREAEALLKSSLTLRKELFGEEHLAVATTLNNLGNLYGSMGDRSRFKLALSFYSRSKAIRERLLTPPHPHLANSLNNLGWIYLNLEWFKMSEAPLLSALEMWEELYGPHHAEVRITLKNLKRLYLSTHRDAELRLIEGRLQDS